MSLEQLETEYEKTQKTRQGLEDELKMLREDFRVLEDKYLKDIANLQKTEDELRQKLIDAENPSSGDEADLKEDGSKEEVQNADKDRTEATTALREAEEKQKKEQVESAAAEEAKKIEDAKKAEEARKAAEVKALEEEKAKAEADAKAKADTEAAAKVAADSTNKAAGGQRCSKCSEPLLPNAKFCKSCGTKTPAALTGNCVKCKHKLAKPDAKFCVRCGSSQDNRPRITRSQTETPQRVSGIFPGSPKAQAVGSPAGSPSPAARTSAKPQSPAPQRPSSVFDVASEGRDDTYVWTGPAPRKEPERTQSPSWVKMARQKSSKNRLSLGFEASPVPAAALAGQPTPTWANQASEMTAAAAEKVQRLEDESFLPEPVKPKPSWLKSLGKQVSSRSVEEREAAIELESQRYRVEEGSEQSLEQKLRAAAALNDPAWVEAGKRPGLQIWRIEKFTVQPVDPTLYGSFYQGDSYIVLHTYYAKPTTRKLAWDVHFWLGAETTQDEAGTAAYKTVELDDLLGGDPVQHREVQNYESDLFLSYFPNGIRIMDGGIESGFTHVAPKEYRSRLLHVKGTAKSVRCSEVPFTTKSLNSGDCFVLDAGLKLFLWQGEGANAHERRKAHDLARAIRAERPDSVLLVCGQGSREANEVYELLAGEEKDVMAAEAGGEDEHVEAKFPTRVFMVSDASGSLQMTEVSLNGVTRAMLLTDEVFIVDVGTEIFCWVGKGSSKAEKKHGIRFASEYAQRFKRPPTIPLSRVFEGSESTLFQSFVPLQETSSSRNLLRSSSGSLLRTSSGSLSLAKPE